VLGIMLEERRTPRGTIQTGRQYKDKERGRKQQRTRQTNWEEQPITVRPRKRPPTLDNRGTSLREHNPRTGEKTHRNRSSNNKRGGRKPRDNRAAQQMTPI